MWRLRVVPWVLAGTVALLAPIATVRTGYAETISQCVDRVTAEIAAAMKDANIVQRVALGVLWEVRVAACFADGLKTK